MQIIIHRGIDQIGGCITEIATSTTRILIDLGQNLPDNEGNANDTLATVETITKLTGGVDAIFYTHYHGDHVGLMEYVPKCVPQYIGGVAKEVIKTKAKYLPNQSPEDFDMLVPYHVMQRIVIGNIVVTPFMVSHSAADAYMLLIEADGKKILHSGDFRDHGYTGKGLRQFVPKYIGQVDVLITEGTMLGRQSEKVKHESDLQRELKEIFQKHKYNFVVCSSTDMDRLATIYSATPKGRLFVCDRYQKDILDIFTASSGEIRGLFKFEELSVFPKDNLLNNMKESGFTMLVRPNQYKTGKYWRFTDLTTNTISNTQRAVIYSMWGGYLDRESTRNPHHIEYLERFGENVERLHTSGHATTECLVELCEMTSPRLAIIPIHSEQSADYFNLPLPEELKRKITISSTTLEDVEVVI
ncbi:MAG: MBL fold metallo-hydrolase [Rikenellaceae bacterium]